MSPLRISVLPTLRSHAGASMRLYPDDLLEGLREIPDVSARVEWPPFGGGEPAGWLEQRWDRYVNYARWARRLEGDVFHISDHSNAQLLVTLPRGQTVITCHDLYPVAVTLGRIRFPGAEHRLSMAPTTLRLSALRKAAAVIAISRHTQEECRKYLGIQSSRLHVAYYGVAPLFSSADGAQALDAFRRRHGLHPDAIHILHVGSNDPRKNLDTVFRVIATLRENSKREIFLLKVGSPFATREHSMLDSLHLRGAVLETGPLSTAETAQAYRGSDVLLYPSFHEGFCRPVAEAMASGTPVVASDRGAIPEVVPAAEWLFAPDDSAGMVRRICEILRSPGRREDMAGQGREAARKFTWQAHGSAVAEVYRRLAVRWV